MIHILKTKIWINTLHKVGKNEGIFMVSDVKLNYPCQVWYFLDDKGDQIFINQPPTVNYPAIKSKAPDFLLKKYPNEPSFGPNMSIDTYWGMKFLVTRQITSISIVILFVQSN